MHRIPWKLVQRLERWEHEDGRDFRGMPVRVPGVQLANMGRSEFEYGVMEAACDPDLWRDAELFQVTTIDWPRCLHVVAPFRHVDEIKDCLVAIYDTAADPHDRLLAKERTWLPEAMRRETTMVVGWWFLDAPFGLAVFVEEADAQAWLDASRS